MPKVQWQGLRPEQAVIAAAAAVLLVALHLPEARVAGREAPTAPEPAGRLIAVDDARSGAGTSSDPAAGCPFAGWQTLTPAEWARRFPGLELEPGCGPAEPQTVPQPQLPHR